MLFRSFRTAEQALRGRDLRTQLTESDELDLFLASTYATKLHPAVDVTGPNSRPAEEAWLAALVGRILPLIMPEREVDSLAVRIIAREIVASAVILPIIDLVSDPDFWNRMIDEKVRFPCLWTENAGRPCDSPGRSSDSRPVRLLNPNTRLQLIALIIQTNGGPVPLRARRSIARARRLVVRPSRAPTHRRGDLSAHGPAAV